MSNNNQIIEKDNQGINDLFLKNTKKRLLSPNSKEALATLGIELNQLFYLTFDDYISQHPDLKGFSRDLQEKRYNHFEEKRKHRLFEVKERRNKIKENSILKQTLSKSHSQTTYDRGSTLINQEIKKLSSFRIKQIGKLKHLINFEFKCNEIRKKNEEKIRLQNQKEEELNQLKKKQAEKEFKMKLLEMKKEEKLKEEQDRKNKEKEKEDRKLFFEEIMKHDEIEKEKYKKMLEPKNKNKQNEYFKKIENVYLEQKEKLIQKQKQIDLKQIHQKKNLELLQKEKNLQNLEKQRIQDEKIKKAQLKNENILLLKQKDFKKKQEIGEEIRKKFID